MGGFGLGSRSRELVNICRADHLGIWSNKEVGRSLSSLVGYLAKIGDNKREQSSESMNT